MKNRWVNGDDSTGIGVGRGCACRCAYQTGLKELSQRVANFAIFGLLFLSLGSGSAIKTWAQTQSSSQGLRPPSSGMRLYFRGSPVGDPRVLSAVRAAYQRGQNLRRTFFPQRFGPVASLGIPEGVGLGLGWLPFSWLRVGLFGSHNFASFGGFAEATFVPWNFRGFSPNLSLLGGYSSPGNANSIVQVATGNRTIDVAVLRSVSYIHAGARLGLEFQGEHFRIYLNLAGVSYVHSVLDGYEATLRTLSGEPLLTSEPLVLNAVIPSASAGAFVHF